MASDVSSTHTALTISAMQASRVELRLLDAFADGVNGGSHCGRRLVRACRLLKATKRLHVPQDGQDDARPQEVGAVVKVAAKTFDLRQ